MAAGRSGDPRVDEAGDESPPFLGRWWRLYALVIVELALMIALCAWLSRLR